MRFTIVGARGWIGGHLADALARGGYDVRTARHDETPADTAGAIVWCSGVSYGAQERPREAFRSHVASLDRWLDAPGIHSFTYLSSSRVYDDADGTSEDVPIGFSLDNVYACSKAAGESLVLACAPNPHIVRLSNVYGSRFESPLFLNDVIRQAVTQRRIALRTSSLDSAKDYVRLESVLDVLPRIALDGAQRIYNVASGSNTPHAQIVAALTLLDPALAVVVPPDAVTTVAPPIDIRRIAEEFGFKGGTLIDDLPQLVGKARTYFSAPATPTDSAAPGRDGGAASG